LSAMEIRPKEVSPTSFVTGTDPLSQNQILIDELAACQRVRLENRTARLTDHEQAIGRYRASSLTNGSGCTARLLDPPDRFCHARRYRSERERSRQCG